MAELLRQMGLLLIISIAVLVLLIISREAIRSIERRQWQKKKAHCRSLLGQLEFLKMEEIVRLSRELENSFSTEIIEALLDELLSDITQQNRSILYDELGFVKHYITIFCTANSWPERANAAEKLGKIGHFRAVPALLAVLDDDNEDIEIKRVALLALAEIRDERAIAPLVESLGHLSDLAIGQVLADVLMQFDEVAVPALVQVLSSSKNTTQRYWAARILRRSKNHNAIAELLNALSDHSAKVRAEASLSLGILRVYEAVVPLTKMILQDPSSLVREAAAESLGNIADDSALAALRDGLADLDSASRRQSMVALERMGDKSIPFFLEAFRGESREARAQASMALERMGVVAGWIEELGQEQWEFAFDQLCCIANTGTIETLIRSLTHPQLSVRIRLCRILAQEGSQRAVDTLVELSTKDHEWVVRLEALLALLKLGDQRLSPIFVRALAEEEENIRERLVRAVREVPRVLTEALIEAVSSLLEDTNLKIRIEAIKTLAVIHTEDVFPFLFISIQDAEPKVRKEAANALQYYPKQEVIQVLIAAIQDHDREVRIAAIKSLGRLKDPQAILPLTQTFEQADRDERDEISAALAAMPIREFYAYVDLLMGLSHPTARAGVAWTLGLLGDQRGLELLGAFLSDPEPKVRCSAAGAIGRFKRKKMVPTLLACLADPNEKVRAAVVNALGYSDTINVIEHLLPMLDNEPDAFVQQSIALALVRLRSSNTSNQSISVSMTIEKIRRWVDKTKIIRCRVSGLIALAILEDEFSFQDVLQSIRLPEMRILFQETLKDLSPVMQKQFFAFLSLDPQLFWRNQDKKAGEHYVWLLRSSRNERDRIFAIRALNTLGEKSAVSAIESALTDPSPRVRVAALNALGDMLSGNRLIEKITDAATDPSDIVRARVITLIQRLSTKELQKARGQFLPLLDTTQADINDQISALSARLYRKDWSILVDQLLGSDKSASLFGLINTLSRVVDPKVAPFFIKFFNHDDLKVRSAAALAAAHSGMLSKQQWLPYLEDPLETMRLAAVRGLGQQLDADIVEIFAQHLQDPSADIRRELVFFLGRKKISDSKHQKEILQNFVKNEHHPAVILISLVSLFQLGVVQIEQEITSYISRMTEEDRKNALYYLEQKGVEEWGQKTIEKPVKQTAVAHWNFKRAV